MTKIVKSIAVVDDRPPVQQPVLPEGLYTGMTVIKQGACGRVVPYPQMQPQPTKQGLQDELNRVKVEIAQSRAELRSLRRELSEAAEELAEAQSILRVDSQDADSVQRKIQEHLEQARQEAEAILQAARTEGESIKEQAANDGYLEGFNKGFEESRNEFIKENQPRCDQLSDMISRVSTYEADQIARNERDLSDLAIAIAGKILGRELSEHRDAVVGMVRDTVDKSRREDFIKIVVAQDLMPVEAKASEEVRALLEGLGANVLVQTDDLMEAGGCMIETPKGLTDLSISTQLNNIASVLKGD